MLGQNVNMLMPSPYAEQHDTYLQKYRNTGVKRIIGRTRMVEARHKNGSIFRTLLSVNEVATDAGYGARFPMCACVRARMCASRG